MYIHGYLRASTKEQDALRAKNRMKAFVEEKGFRLASWYTENVSEASLQRPELLRLLDDAAPGDFWLNLGWSGSIYRHPTAASLVCRAAVTSTSRSGKKLISLIRYLTSNYNLTSSHLCTYY